MTTPELIANLNQAVTNISNRVQVLEDKTRQATESTSSLTLEIAQLQSAMQDAILKMDAIAPDVV